MAELKIKSKGKDVRNLQEALNKAGAKPPLNVDGDFGKLTNAALLKFQSKQGLAPNGIADALTLAALKLGPKPKPEKTGVSDYGPLLKQNEEALRHIINGSSDVIADFDEGIKKCRRIQKAVKDYGAFNSAFLKELLPKMQDIIDLQKQFEAFKSRDLVKAGALIAEINRMNKEVKSMKAAYAKKADDFNKKITEPASAILVAFDGFK